MKNKRMRSNYPKLAACPMRYRIAVRLIAAGTCSRNNNIIKSLGLVFASHFCWFSDAMDGFTIRRRLLAVANPILSYVSEENF